jgi:aminoglycoside/choline kinase family phosphotransferase
VPDTTVPAGITGYLERHRVDAARVVPLTGDASDRRYFRVIPRSGPSFVLALYATPFDYATLPFVNVTSLFEAMPVPVPRLLGDAGDLGVLALQDLGDVTLQAQLGAASADERDRWYAHAADLLVTLQRRGRELADPRYVPYGIAFDVEKLTWEMDFFVRHFLEAYRGVDLAPATRDALRGALRTIVEALAAEPRVLCHRDYHSRNLMVAGDALYVIDFQDARMGPDTYDLVSLLRDSYVDLPEALVDRVMTRFASAIGARDVDAFRDRFDLMAMQRNLKALGTFGYQAVTRANPVYAQYVPRTLRYVRDNLARHRRFDRLGEILTTVLPELRNAGPEGPALRDDTVTPQASSPEPASVSKPSASAKATADT